MSLLKSRFIEMFGSVNFDNSKFTIIKLGDAAKVGSSHRVFTNEFVDKGVPFYRGTEISELSNGAKPSKPFYISLEHYKKISNDDTKPQIGDILMPSICDKGQLWLVDTNLPFYYKDGRVLCISPNKNLFVPAFLHYFLKIKTISEYKKIGSGSTFAEFKIFQLKNINVILPPKNQQEKFSEILKQIDKSKFLLQQILEKLELLKKSRFIEMFKNSETLRLDQIAEVTMGQSPDSSSYNSVGKGIPFYQGKTEFTDKYIGQPSTWCTSPTRIAKENDILMSVRAPVGNVNIATEECCIGRGLSSIRPQNGFNSEFIFEALEQKKEELENKATGSTFKAINKDIVLSIQIPNTSISIQKEYSNFVKQIDKSKFNVFQDQTAAQVKVIVVLHHIC